MNENIKPQDIKFSPDHLLKKSLNPKLWDGQKLDREVKKKLMKIADAFIEYLAIKAKPLDIIIAGSNTNYNWNNQSDIDLHIIYDFKKINKDQELVKNFLDAKRFYWNTSRNIKIHGFDVELYSQDSSEENASTSVYSLMEDKWLKEPKLEELDIDEETVRKKSSDIINQIDKILKLKDDEKKYKSIDKLKAKIKKMRQSGLEKDGEFSTENLTFKVLRRSGYLEKMSDASQESMDKTLSLSESTRFIISESHKNEYGCLMLFFEVSWWDKITNRIKPEDIFEGDGYGIEKEPHVTLLFGFHDNVDMNKLEEIVQDIIKNPITIELNNISAFKQDEFDVLKFEVDSQILSTINKKLTDNFEYTNEHGGYHPHMTISYLKPGASDKYTRHLDKPITMKASSVVYSSADEEQKTWLFKKKNQLAIDKRLNFDDEKRDLIQDFISFTCCKLGMEQPVKVVIKNGRDEYITTTAAYSPSENENHIRAGGRALVDVLRSIGHELVHNRQREIGMFKIGEQVQDIGGKIEDQANSIAGILIKDFAKNHGNDKIYDF